mmetsp:Transcript_28667/g.60804  ORF Transcript_28667/g.60804 Transcript_28667/m.60804 type:complete len:406 (-) Transcript_28667:118-1335(-)
MAKNSDEIAARGRPASRVPTLKRCATAAGTVVPLKRLRAKTPPSSSICFSVAMTPLPKQSKHGSLQPLVTPEKATEEHRHSGQTAEGELQEVLRAQVRSEVTAQVARDQLEHAHISLRAQGERISEMEQRAARAEAEASFLRAEVERAHARDQQVSEAMQGATVAEQRVSLLEKEADKAKIWQERALAAERRAERAEGAMGELRQVHRSFMSWAMSVETRLTGGRSRRALRRAAQHAEAGCAGVPYPTSPGPYGEVTPYGCGEITPYPNCSGEVTPRHAEDRGDEDMPWDETADQDTGSASAAVDGSGQADSSMGGDSGNAETLKAALKVARGQPLAGRASKPKEGGNGEKLDAPARRYETRSSKARLLLGPAAQAGDEASPTSEDASPEWSTSVAPAASGQQYS